MLLPGRQWTKEPPSAGFRGRCSGGLAANKESKWRENGSWRRRTPRETRSHVKYGPGVHSCGCFSFLLLFLPLCSMSPSPHVCLWFSSFMPWPVLCSSSLIGQKLSYFIDHGQAMNKDDWQYQKCGRRVKRLPPPGLIRCNHQGAPCSMMLRLSPFPL